MEVAIKKIKITKTMFSQILDAGINDFRLSNVLGWCFQKNRQWIMLYNPTDNSLKKYPLFESASIVANSNRSKNSIEIKHVGLRYIEGYFRFDNESEAEDFLKIIVDVKNQAVNKGQFFI